MKQSRLHQRFTFVSILLSSWSKKSILVQEYGRNNGEIVERNRWEKLQEYCTKSLREIAERTVALITQPRPYPNDPWIRLDQRWRGTPWSRSGTRPQVVELQVVKLQVVELLRKENTSRRNLKKLEGKIKQVVELHSRKENAVVSTKMQVELQTESRRNSKERVVHRRQKLENKENWTGGNRRFKWKGVTTLTLTHERRMGLE